MLKYILNLTIYAGLLLLVNPVTARDLQNNTIENSLLKLKEGNSRFLKKSNRIISRREKLVKAQHPFAVIITCSDSRVSPEIIFDQGLGDIFEIRNAGNVLDDHVIGSIEYAVAHLGTALIVVLGHQNCGAVQAAIEHSKETEHIQSLVKSIEPAVKEALRQKGDLLENAVKNNVRNVIKELKQSEPIIKKYIEEGKLKVIGGYYHLDSGVVDFFIKDD